MNEIYWKLICQSLNWSISYPDFFYNCHCKTIYIYIFIERSELSGPPKAIFSRNTIYDSLISITSSPSNAELQLKIGTNQFKNGINLI